MTSLCASVPAHPDIVKAWLEARKPAVTVPGGRSIAEIQEEVFSTLAEEQRETEEKTQLSLLVFQRIDGHLAVRAATVRAHLKECARIIGREHVGKIKGEAAFSTRFINCVYHDEAVYWLPILDGEGSPVGEPTGRRPKAVHTFYGSALKTFEYVNDARLDFTLKVLGSKISVEDISTGHGIRGDAWLRRGTRRRGRPVYFHN